MKRISMLAVVLLASAGFAAAQMQNPTSDVLGAHLNYGRGCAACHAPHSGARGNGLTTTDTTSGNIALWGEDASNLYSQTLVTGQSEHGSYTEILPASMSAGTPDVSGVLMCLSCHDGNYAKGAMMKNKVYETLPSTYGTGTIPTLLGVDGNGNTSGQTAYLNDHPVGLNAIMTCGGTYDWDCSISATGAVQMNGTASAAFVTNYGFFVSPGVYNTKPVVLCTTCHNQHLMNVVKVTASKSGLPAGNYATMFFIRAPYNPASGTAGSNQTAQFCRQCHGGEANEMNGGMTIPTTF
ncbi:MAG: hypothetical protein P4L40_05965 [Terracidiphilus sp.]|nr:hypothetical protein [Terracidiphilus sp.]